MLQQIEKTLYVYYGQTLSNKIAAFDLDGTIIRTKKGDFLKMNSIGLFFQTEF